MDEKLPPWESDPIGFLVDRLFPDQKTFANSAYWEQFAEQKTRYDRAKAEADNFIANLAAQDGDLVFRLVEREKQKFIDERIESAVSLDQTRFFNDRRADTDWNFWSQISLWTAEEAAAISLGKDPRVVNLRSIRQYEGHSVFVPNFQSQLQLIVRAIEAGQLAEKNVPSFFLAWAERTGFLMHPMAFEAVKARGHQIADWKTEYDRLSEFLGGLAEERDQTKAELDVQISKSQAELQAIHDATIAFMTENAALEARIAELEASALAPVKQDLPLRERKSALTLILAMAMKKYQYDPSRSKNPATGNIASSIQQIGLKLDEDTIRKFLNEAKGLLDDKTE